MGSSSYLAWQLEKYGNVLPNNHAFPPDERTDDEIWHDKFDNWQQQYEYEQENR